MPKLAGIQHQRAVKAFEKAGFRAIREGKHISMVKDDRIIIIPRNNPTVIPSAPSRSSRLTKDGV